ncbi:7971_t:CDS:2, partial [Racocetra fulgida]
CEKPGIIRAKIRLNDPWDEFSLLKPNVNIGSLAKEKQVDLWKNISPYCPIAFRNKLCPKLDDNLIERVGRRRRARAKDARN